MKHNRYIAVMAVLGACFISLPMAALAYDTSAVSEEDPPAVCDIGDAVISATC